MTISYFPFDAGQGSNVTEEQWHKMSKHWIETGVLETIMNNLEVYADSSGMQVKVKSGAAWINGHYFESDTEEVLSVGNADPTNPRIDRVIVRMDRGLNLIELAVLQGGSAVSPTVPTLTQNTTRWEISLAQINVDAGVLTITPDKVTDDRVFALENKTFVNLGRGLGLSFAGDVDYKLSYNSKYEDMLDEFDSDAFIPEKSGVYMVSSAVTFTTTPSGYTYFRIYENGELKYTLTLGYENAGVSSARSVYLKAGNKYSFYVNQAAPQTVELRSASLQIARL